MFFAGMTCVGIFVTRSGDLYGRRWPTMISSTLSIPLTLAIFFSNNLTVTIILFFLQGACAPGKVQVAFVYMTEFIAKQRHRTYVGTAVLFADAATMILVSLYFRFVSKYWLPFQIGSLAFNVLSVTLLWIFIPESPKYLLSKGKIEQAKKAIKWIAKFNGVKSIDIN